MKDLNITERELYHVFTNVYFMGTEEFRNEMYSYVSDMWIAFTDKVGCASIMCRNCKHKKPCDVYYYLIKGMEYINEHETSLAGIAIEHLPDNE